MPRHELTDDQWARVEPLLPANGGRGGQWSDHRPLVNGMVWRLKTGSPWRDVPPLRLAGDKGCSADRIRDWLADRGIDPAIARKGPERRPGDGADFDREAYRRRNVVERCVGWLKECRALATRFEKLAVNYMGIVRLAMIVRYLRFLDSSDTA